jgi:hypothetical protein
MGDKRATNGKVWCEDMPKGSRGSKSAEQAVWPVVWDRLHDLHRQYRNWTWILSAGVVALADMDPRERHALFTRVNEEHDRSLGEEHPLTVRYMGKLWAAALLKPSNRKTAMAELSEQIAADAGLRADDRSRLLRQIAEWSGRSGQNQRTRNQ